jgi:hypothetical protein
VNDCENPWVNDPENPQLRTLYRVQPVRTQKGQRKIENAGQELSFFRGMSEIPTWNRGSLNSFSKIGGGRVVFSQASKNAGREWLFSV